MTTPIRQVGGYQLRSQLGEGGMGVVYHGVDARGRSAAVKVLRPHVAGDQEGRDRFAREVRAMRRVHGPWVAEVLDADVTGNPPYVATTYIDGPPLYRVVADHGPLQDAELARLGHGLAEALRAIHAAGVVHRDLKPGNVLMVRGNPVVIDFGIAQVADETRLTSTGLLIGTPGYLAPEVLDGQPASWASDIHSWAATMAFAATGRPPFGRGPFQAVAYRVTTGRADLAGVPDWLLPVLRRAMAQHPGERPRPAELAALIGRPDVARLLPPGSDRPQVPPTVGTVGPAPTRQLTHAPEQQRVAHPHGQRPPWPERLPRFLRPRPVFTLLLLLIAAAAGASAPFLTLSMLCLAFIVARTVDRQRWFIRDRRERRGIGRSDMVVAVSALPLHVARSAFFTAVTLPLAGLGGLAAGIIMVLFAPAFLPMGNTHVMAGLFVGATVLLAWWGIEGESLRAGTRRLVRTVTGRPPVIVVTALMLTAILAALLLDAASGPVNWSPFHGGPQSVIGGLVSWLKQHQFFA